MSRGHVRLRAAVRVADAAEPADRGAIVAVCTLAFCALGLVGCGDDVDPGHGGAGPGTSGADAISSTVGPPPEPWCDPAYEVTDPPSDFGDVCSAFVRASCAERERLGCPGAYHDVPCLFEPAFCRWEIRATLRCFTRAAETGACPCAPADWGEPLDCYSSGVCAAELEMASACSDGTSPWLNLFECEPAWTSEQPGDGAPEVPTTDCRAGHTCLDDRGFEVSCTGQPDGTSTCSCEADGFERDVGTIEGQGGEACLLARDVCLADTGGG